MVFFYGDIHGEINELLIRLQEADAQPGDTVVLLGDVGLNYFVHRSKDLEKKETLEKTGLNFLCIHGNHERRPATLPFYHLTEWRGGQAFIEDDYPHLFFAKDGEVYDLEGHSAIALGGAYSVDKFLRLALEWSWFPDEQPSDAIKAEAEQKLDALGWKVDYVLSHTCPTKYIPIEAFLPSAGQIKVDRSTEDWLDRIEDRLQYSSWYCGHWHIDKRIDKMHFLYKSLE